MEKRNAEPAKLSLPSDREIVIERKFRAPKHLVFEAWSKPEHVTRWYPCSQMTMPVCEIDLRVGGRWRWVMRDTANGIDHPVSGEYREIVRPDRIVLTQRYEPVPGSDHLVTIMFEEQEGMTLVTQRILHPSKEGRDAHLGSGMAGGIDEAFARIDQLLAAIDGLGAAQRPWNERAPNEQA